MFLFGPLGGVFADRMDKRRVLCLTQTLSGLLAAAFATLVATGSLRLWAVYLLALALGFVNVFDNPARQAFISEMVTAEDLPNAVTLNSVAMNMARVLGAALGGVIAAALGLALCFAVNALSFGAVLISLAAMRGSELFPATRVPRRKRQVRAGLRYVRSTPELLIPLVMIAVIGTLAWLGSTPIGGPIVGWVGQDAGARWSLVVGGLPTLLCGILALPALARIDRRGTGDETPAADADKDADTVLSASG
jgi:MFS family permease